MCALVCVLVFSCVSVYFQFLCTFNDKYLLRTLDGFLITVPRGAMLHVYPKAITSAFSKYCGAPPEGHDVRLGGAYHPREQAYLYSCYTY